MIVRGIRATGLPTAIRAIHDLPEALPFPGLSRRAVVRPATPILAVPARRASRSSWRPRSRRRPSGSARRAHHVADVIEALHGWVHEQGPGGQLTILGIEPAAGGFQAGGASGPKTAALREFAFTTIPLKDDPGPARRRTSSRPLSAAPAANQLALILYATVVEFDG